MEEIFQLAQQLGDRLCQVGKLVTTAESCTGGGISHAITSVAGSSSWFEMGYVVYSNRAKQQLLNVSAASLQSHGAVSEVVVREMATSALTQANADYAVAVSGVAGPGGGSADKPVGTVWFAWAFKDGKVHTLCQQFSGDRNEVRDQTVVVALRGLLADVEASA